MRVQLIHPPAFLNPTALTALRPSLPLGLAYIAGSVRAAGHEVSVIDAVGEDPDRVVRRGRIARLGLPDAEIVARIDPETQVVGITAMFTYQWHAVRDLILAIKEARPDLLVVGGGEHFTGLPETSLLEAPADIVVIGEGEETMVALLARYAAWLSGDGTEQDVRSQVPRWAAGLEGTAYLDQGRFVQEPRRDRIRGVDAIPWPAWDLFGITEYDSRRLVNGVKKGVTIPLLATRGCPYQCKYCSSPNAWTTLWKARDVKLVVDEIEHYVKTYGATNFPFQDLTAILKRQWVVDFCTELLDRDLGVTWQMPTGTRCEVVDDEVASLLQRTGALQVNFAPESGSEEVRKKIDKRMKEKSLFDAVAAAVRNKLNVTCFFVLGFPGDRVEDLRETVRWTGRLAKLGIDDVAVGFYFPIPGTRFFDELKSRGSADLTDDLMMAPIFVHDRWLTKERNYSESLSARTLTWWRYRAVWAFYSRAILLRPKRLFRVFRNFLAGREESKFDSFLQILKERFFTRRAKVAKAPRAPTPAPAPAPAPATESLSPTP